MANMNLYGQKLPWIHDCLYITKSEFIFFRHLTSGYESIKFKVIPRFLELYKMNHKL